MHRKRMYCAGTTAAIRFAVQFLRSEGFPVSEKADWDVGHLLLDVPSFRDSETLRSGGRIDTLLASLPRNITIWGGNLNRPVLEGYSTVDLLTDEQYLTQNAAITADCALKVASPLLADVWQETPALVIGWGRIGKYLSKLLKDMGSEVTVTARDLSKRYVLESMGYRSADPQHMNDIADRFRIVFNTAPETVIGEGDTPNWQHCIKIDLASQKGIAGDDVIWARGLPGIHAPERSGKLIAKTIERIWKERSL